MLWPTWQLNSSSSKQKLPRLQHSLNNNSKCSRITIRRATRSSTRWRVFRMTQRCRQPPSAGSSGFARSKATNTSSKLTTSLCKIPQTYRDSKKSFQKKKWRNVWWWSCVRSSPTTKIFKTNSSSSLTRSRQIFTACCMLDLCCQRAGWQKFTRNI